MPRFISRFKDLNISMGGQTAIKFVNGEYTTQDESEVEVIRNCSCYRRGQIYEPPTKKNEPAPAEEEVVPRQSGPSFNRRG